MDSCYVDGCAVPVEKYLGKREDFKIPYCKPHYESVKGTLKQSSRRSDKLIISFSETKMEPNEPEISASPLRFTTIGRGLYDIKTNGPCPTCGRTHRNPSIARTCARKSIRYPEVN